MHRLVRSTIRSSAPENGPARYASAPAISGESPVEETPVAAAAGRRGESGRTRGACGTEVDSTGRGTAGGAGAAWVSAVACGIVSTNRTSPSNRGSETMWYATSTLAATRAVSGRCSATCTARTPPSTRAPIIEVSNPADGRWPWNTAATIRAAKSTGGASVSAPAWASHNARHCCSDPRELPRPPRPAGVAAGDRRMSSAHRTRNSSSAHRLAAVAQRASLASTGDVPARHQIPGLDRGTRRRSPLCAPSVPRSPLVLRGVNDLAIVGDDAVTWIETRCTTLVWLSYASVNSPGIDRCGGVGELAGVKAERRQHVLEGPEPDVRERNPGGNADLKQAAHRQRLLGEAREPRRRRASPSRAAAVGTPTGADTARRQSDAARSGRRCLATPRRSSASAGGCRDVPYRLTSWCPGRPQAR